MLMIASKYVETLKGHITVTAVKVLYWTAMVATVKVCYGSHIHIFDDY